MRDSLHMHVNSTRVELTAPRPNPSLPTFAATSSIAFAAPAEIPGGNAGIWVTAGEDAGVTAVGLFAEMAGADGTGPPVVVPPDRATAMVSTGNYDITPFVWGGSAYPISSSQSIYVNPTKDSKGELQIQQNFARVGSKQIDDLMNKAEETLDKNQAFTYTNQADALVWNEVHSIVMYQRPQLTAVNKNLANVGSYGFAQPDYTKIGFVNSPT